MDSLTAPREFSLETPRAVTAQFGYIFLMCFLSATMVASISLGVFATSGIYFADNALKMRGLAENADILALYAGMSQTNNPTMEYHVVYRYTVRPSSDFPESSFRGEGLVAKPLYDSLRIGQKAPIVYDPQWPDHSRLKFVGIVHEDPIQAFVPLLAIASPISVICCASIILLYIIYRKHRHLLAWGRTACATIVGELEYDLPGNPLVAVTYSFEDSAGVTHTGFKGCVSRRNNRRPEFSDERIKPLDKPVVLYDPKKPTRNMLYPSAWVRLVD